MKTKQVIVIRKDLACRRGKQISQGAHSALAFITNDLLNMTEEQLDDAWDGYGEYRFDLILTEEEMHWIRNSFKKVTLQVSSEEELLEVERKAREAGLNVHLITDSGLTEFHNVPTVTCLAIGPHEESRIDAITQDLKLY